MDALGKPEPSICLRGHRVPAGTVLCNGRGVALAPDAPSWLRRVWRYGVKLGFVLLFVGLGGVSTSPHHLRAEADRRNVVTASNGYTASEANFLDYLDEVDAELLQTEPNPALYTAGRRSCADFRRGQTEEQVVRTEEVAVRRTRTRLSAAQVGELVPVAVLELCPAFLSAITISVD